MYCKKDKRGKYNEGIDDLYGFRIWKALWDQQTDHRIQGEPLYLHGLLSLQKQRKLVRKTEKINCQLILISQYERVLSGSVEQVPEAERFFNEDSDQGITASIKLGTEVAGINADAYLYFVADQPCMQGETIARVCQ